MSDANALKTAFETLNQKHTLKPGDLVEWKPGMRNRKFPEMGEPVIVVAVLDPPTIDSSRGSESPYFHESLDLVYGWIDLEKDLILLHTDSRRFQPLEKTKEA